MNENQLERFEHFKVRGKELHGEKFDYSEVEYVNAKTKVKIICQKHGDFYQVPDKHLAQNSKGCQQCWGELRLEMAKTIDHTNFRTRMVPEKEILERFTEKFNHKFNYDLSGYNGIAGNKITITCPIHGEFKSTPHNHLLCQTGCPKCGLVQKDQSKTSTFEELVREMGQLYSFRYEYPECNKETYKTKRSKIDIICKEHGKFTKTAQKHLSGQHCWQCTVDKMIRDDVLVGGYSERLFEEKLELKSQKAILYYLTINNGEYYKIGITRTDIRNRLRSLKSKSKKYIKTIMVVKELKANLYDCFQLEQKILKDNEDNRVFTGWSTELFDVDIWPKISEIFEPTVELTL